MGTVRTIPGYGDIAETRSNVTTIPGYGDYRETASAGTTISPDVGALTITGHAPSIVQTANQIIAPSTGALTITGQAPTIARTENQTVAPSAGALSITGHAPTVVQAAGSQTISPGVGQLTVTGHAPTVMQVSAGQFSGGSFHEVPRVHRKKSVEQEREDLGIIPRRVQKVIAEVAKRSVTMIKTDEQADGLLKNALSELKIPESKQYIAAMQSQRDRILQRDIARAMLIKQRQEELRRDAIRRQQEAEDEEFSVEMLLL